MEFVILVLRHLLLLPGRGRTAAASVLLNRERPGVNVEKLLQPHSDGLSDWGEVTVFHVITVLFC